MRLYQQTILFLLASLLNIAGGQPFSATQILWINFVITAPVVPSCGACFSSSRPSRSVA